MQRGKKSRLFYFFLLICLFGSAEEATWASLYEKLFSKETPNSIDEVEKLVTKKFQNSNATNRYLMAILLMKLDDERSAPSGRWADFILNASEPSLLSDTEYCAALMQSASAHFLSREFSLSEERYQTIYNNLKCSKDERDFADFQRGWIEINRGNKLKALQKWFSLISTIFQRETPSLHKVSVIKETASLALELKDEGLFKKLKDMLQKEEEKDAFVEGSLNALTFFLKNFKNDKSDFLNLKLKIESEFDKNRLMRIFPTTKLALLMPACRAIEWFPRDIDNKIILEKIEECASEIVVEKKSAKKDAFSLGQEVIRFENCSSCQIRLAHLNYDLGNYNEACINLLKPEILQKHAEKISIFCSNHHFSSEESDKFFSSLFALNFNLIDASTLQVISDFAKAKAREIDFAKRYEKNLLVRASKSSKFWQILTLDFLRSELERNQLHEELLNKFSHLNNSDLGHEWNLLEFSYSLEKIPLFESWKKYFDTDPAFREAKMRSPLLQVTINQSLRGEVSINNLKLVFSEREHFLRKFLLVINGVEKVSVFNREESDVLGSERKKVLVKYSQLLDEGRKLGDEVQNKSSSSAAFLETFIRKFKRILLIKSNLSSEYLYLTVQLDIKLLELLNDYKFIIENATQEVGSFWQKNPKIVEQFFLLISKWQASLRGSL